MIAQEREIVLPSGAFCRIRRLTGADLVRLNLEKVGKSDDKADPSFTLLTYCLHIDDKPVTYDQLEKMDLRDVMVLSRELNILIGGPIT
jgi:hypothetical protein